MTPAGPQRRAAQRAPLRPARLRDRRPPMRIAVCSAQVPFARGGTEIFVEDLAAELRKRDHEAELVTVPYKWYPGTRVLDAGVPLAARRSERGGRAAHRPGHRYQVPHVRGAASEQGRLASAPVSPGLRADGTELGQFSDSADDRATRRAIHALDKRVLGEARKLFTTSRNNQQRLQSSTGLVAEVLPHPPQELPYRCDDYGDFVLSVGRLDRAKRVDLLIEAAAESSFSVVVAGDGPDRGRLEDLAGKRSLDGRVRFLGRVDEDELADLYARCLAVFYAPVDEDFGMFLRGIPGGQARRDDRRRRRAARGRDRPQDRIVAELRAAAVADACACMREHLDCGARSAAPGTRSPTRSPGIARSPGFWNEGCLLLAAPAGAPRNRGLQRSCRPRSSAGSTSRLHGAAGRPCARPTSRSTTSATTRRHTVGSWTRCDGGRVSWCCTTSSCTTSSPG